MKRPLAHALVLRYETVCGVLHAIHVELLLQIWYLLQSVHSPWRRVVVGSTMRIVPIATENQTFGTVVHNIPPKL
jgi:hypothetical protein